MIIFAADDLTTLSGGGGWVGAGLLGLVLAWLFFKMIPSKDAQQKELVVIIRELSEKSLMTNSTMAENISAKFAETTKASQSDHTAAMLRLHAECREERREWQEALRSNNNDSRKPASP